MDEEKKKFDRGKRWIVRVDNYYKEIEKAKQSKNYGKWISALINLQRELEPMMNSEDLSKLDKLMEEIMKSKNVLMSGGKTR